MPDRGAVRSGVARPDILTLSNVEVVYDHVILVLKGVSLKLQEGRILALLGANGAGKTTTLKAISNLLHAERGQVTKGEIRYRGEIVQNLSPSQMVEKGIIQVMEGRRCFEHLTVEENLLTGATTRSVSSKILQQDIEKIYSYFPQLKKRRKSLAGYVSGGEQQMCAIGRALMAKPQCILLDEPSLGLAPQMLAEIFTIIASLNRNEGVSMIVAEQNTNIALRYADYGYVLENGRVVLDGNREDLYNNSDIREFYLGISGKKENFRSGKSYKRRKRWLD